MLLEVLSIKFRKWYYQLLTKLGVKADEVYYIGGSTVLPSPLTKEEEEKYLKLLSQGDDYARSILIERNLRLVVYIARKFENTGINIEDLISIGTIGLIKAVNTFDVDRNINLSNYVLKCIKNKILMYLRRTSRMRQEISFDEPLNVDWDGNELLLSDVLGTDPDIITKQLESAVDKDLLKKALSGLNDRERKIMTLRFGLQNKSRKTQKDVADLLGISQSYISRLEKKIIKQLKHEFKKMI